MNDDSEAWSRLLDYNAVNRQNGKTTLLIDSVCDCIINDRPVIVLCANSDSRRLIQSMVTVKCEPQHGQLERLVKFVTITELSGTSSEVLRGRSEPVLVDNHALTSLLQGFARFKSLKYRLLAMTDELETLLKTVRT